MIGISLGMLIFGLVGLAGFASNAFPRKKLIISYL